jgi:nucleoside 2-deoxyribosyltransferase
VKTPEATMKIYFAAPLFSEVERDWIRSTIQKIDALSTDQGIRVEIVFPYDLITQGEINSLGSNAKREIFSRCKSHLDSADMLIALLDGSQTDDGTAWEIGYFYRGKPEGAKIIGVRTDFRNAGESTAALVNAMVECACDRIVRSTEELMQVLAHFISGGNADQSAGRPMMSVGRLSKDEIATLQNAIEHYDFPCVYYDFFKNCAVNGSTMHEVEEFIRNDLTSKIPDLVKNGLSNVLYWGFAKAGFRDTRVSIFRNNVTQEQLKKSAILFSNIHGDCLKQIKDIDLPQFSQMSFVSKIRMFIDPDQYVVLDRVILRMRKEPFPTILNGISFGDKEIAIRISNNNIQVYRNWCRKCSEISQVYYGGKYRPVDIERGFFSLIRKGQVNLAARILSKA